MITAEARGAWRELDARLRPYIARRISSPADVDDVLQEVFVRMHRGLADIRDEERFGGWVYRIAAHAIADHARTRARHPFAPEAAEKNLGAREAPLAGDEAEALESSLAECIALFVARLPSPYREAITLTELQGLTQRQAAEMMGLSLSGMKSRVQRGRDQIRAMFEECCRISLDCRGRIVQCEPRSDRGAATGSTTSDASRSPTPGRCR